MYYVSKITKTVKSQERKLTDLVSNYVKNFERLGDAATADAWDGGSVTKTEARKNSTSTVLL